MLRDIKPHLEYVANRNAVVQNNGAKHGFVVPGNTDIHVRIDIYGACREPELLENPWIHALYIKVGLYPVHEPELERFGGGKQRETRPRPMNTGDLSASTESGQRRAEEKACDWTAIWRFLLSGSRN